MSHIDTTTPQLKLIDKTFDAYDTRDISNAAPFLSKNFTYRSFPKIAELPDQTKDEHIELFGPMFARLDKLDHVFHEAIEAPGKVVLRWTALCTPPGCPTFEYDSVSIFTLVEEDGELKFLEMKDFADPEKRTNFFKTLSGAGEVA